MTPHMQRLLAVATVASALAYATPAQSSRETPQAAAQSLLDADARFATSRDDVLQSLGAMFAPGVMMPGGASGVLVGRDAVLAAIRAQTDVVTSGGVSRATWRALRAGVSADGQHGFTFGYFTLVRADGSTLPSKYMAYWTREGGAWHVIGYKRGRTPSAVSDAERMAPALPKAIGVATRDANVLTRLRHELMQREGEFSATAQRIGLGNAFVEFGSADAVNMGGAASATYLVGAKAIAALVSGGDMKASPVHWGADTALVASSGDLGITFGVIRPNTVPAGGDPNAGSAFFTIWRRPDIRSPWRYVAE